MTATRSPFGWLIHVLTRYLTWCIMGGMLLGIAAGSWSIRAS